MKKLLLAAIAMMALVTSVHAITVSSTWQEEGDDLRLDDTVLGDWCVVKTARVDGKNTRIYERNRSCFSRQWIVIGVNSYRTSDRECRVHEPPIKSSNYHKNLVIVYECTSFDSKKSWFERAEFGFSRPTMEIDQLYIIRD
jgi:hypothetical protein